MAQWLRALTVPVEHPSSPHPLDGSQSSVTSIPRHPTQSSVSEGTSYTGGTHIYMQAKLS